MYVLQQFPRKWTHIHIFIKVQKSFASAFSILRTPYTKNKYSSVEILPNAPHSHTLFHLPALLVACSATFTNKNFFFLLLVWPHLLFYVATYGWPLKFSHASMFWTFKLNSFYFTFSWTAAYFWFPDFSISCHSRSRRYERFCV